MPDIEALDPNMAAADPEGDWLWFDATQLTLEGRTWPDPEKPFDRLPARAKRLVDEAVWNRGTCSAGLAVRFLTDAARLAARWEFNGYEPPMDHMAATGSCGLDLYVRHEGRMKFAAVGRVIEQPPRHEFFRDAANARREFAVYLPLYKRVTKLEIGIPPGATLTPAPERTDKPIACYGTSIVHGGCASRPGMAYPAQLGRRFDRPALNLGFSGNGRMQPEVVELLCELDPALYLVDCLPNMTAEVAAERVEPTVRRLREARPQTPIVLVDNILYTNAHLLTGRREHHEKANGVQRGVYDKLVAEGASGLYYIEDDALIGEDDEGTIDGVHPTDLGFSRMAKAIGDGLAPLLG